MRPITVLKWVLLVLCWWLAGCTTIREEPARTPGIAPVAAPPTRPLPQAEAKWKGEPLIGVFIHETASLRIELLTAMALPDSSVIPAGSHELSWSNGEVAIDGRRLGFEVTLAPRTPAKPTAALALPDAPRFLLGGALLVRVDGNQLEFIERLPMEQYLAGVLPVEMAPSWPVAALAAQAIAARSYAAAKTLERSTRPWQLHRSFKVDMAYGGWRAEPGAGIRQALERTRGEILEIHGQPLQAMFHAASGGRTEDCVNIWPGLKLPDGVTPAAERIPGVDDEASTRGAQALKLAASHDRWKVELKLTNLIEPMRVWSTVPGRPRIGAILSVKILERHPGSQRVAKIEITHRLDRRDRTTELTGAQFREAVGPVKLRSLWWDRISVVKGTLLVIEGRGFGHGVGLSQVGAWQMARDGADEQRIIRHYYPKAALERRW